MRMRDFNVYCGHENVLMINKTSSISIFEFRCSCGLFRSHVYPKVHSPLTSINEATDEVCFP